MPQFEVKRLKELLSSTFGDDFEIIDQRSKMLTPPGEHYGSIMLALDVTIRRDSTQTVEELNLVAKMLPASEMLRTAFDVQVTFKKEIDAYVITIPALIDFQKEYNVPKERLLDIFPQCYGARLSIDQNEVDDDAVLIFENLKVQGYDTGDRFIGFDYDHAKMIVQDLAKFHAVPIAMRIIDPDRFQAKIGPCIVKNSGIETLPEDVGSAFKDSILDTIVQIPECEPYVKIVEDIVMKSEEDMKNKNAPQLKSDYATAVHSDYWVNNTMVLQDKEGNPLKNKIVDLQIMQYDSALRDLVFFLFTSVINSVLDEHYEDLIKIYHETFVEYLSDFKIDLEMFTWEKFLEELEYIGPQEFHHVAFMLKPIFTEKGKINNLADFQPSDWGRRDLLGPAHKEKLKDTILAFAKRKWI